MGWVMGLKSGEAGSDAFESEVDFWGKERRSSQQNCLLEAGGEVGESGDESFQVVVREVGSEQMKGL
jgi:hypothetical protein